MMKIILMNMILLPALIIASIPPQNSLPHGSSLSYKPGTVAFIRPNSDDNPSRDKNTNINTNEKLETITYVRPTFPIDDVKAHILTSPGLTLVLACASFDKQSQSLIAEIEARVGKDAPEASVIILNTDESEDIEELAIELDLKSIPSYQVYRNGNVIASGDDSMTNYESMMTSLKNESSLNVKTPSTDKDDILKLVSKSYSDTLQKKQNCCVSVDSTLNGYSLDDLAKAGTDANLGLGCGNPISFANLQKGETVLDLGSGAGIDCFIAAAAVGTDGTAKKGGGGMVIGVDMTPDMIHAARRNAKNRNVTNVQFRLGEIEHLPVGDGTVDCVISNCVINLSPDKPQVFRDMYRVLKKGGRIAISDVILRPRTVLPERLLTEEALACCVSGAPAGERVETFLADAGFRDIKVEIKEESREVIKQWLPGSGAEDFVVSAEITAKK